MGSIDGQRKDVVALLVKNMVLTLKLHLWGILNELSLGVHNGHAENTHARSQRIKARACGFRSRERFRNAIYFHCGGLEIMPEGVESRLGYPPDMGKPQFGIQGGPFFNC